MTAHNLFEPEVSSQRWRGTPPPHWPLKRLKWSISGLHSGIWGDEPDGENDIICIRVADFDRIRGSVSNEPPTTRSVIPSYREQRMLRRGDLLIEKSGGGDNQLVGCVVHFDHDFDAVCSNFVARMPLKDGMLPQYWNYVHSSLYSARLNFPAIKQTTGIQNLDAEAYLNIEVAFPPLQEQCAIANYLDRETARIDGLIAEKERMLALLEEKRAALISRVITRGLDPNAPLKPSGHEWLGEIPAHWKMSRLKYLGETVLGLTFSPDDLVNEGEGVLVLRASNVKNRKIVLEDNIFVRTDIPENLRTRPLDIVICSRSGSRALIGKNALITDETSDLTFGAFMTIFRSRLNKFLFWMFNSTLFDFQAGAFGTSTINQLTTETLANMEVPVPPPEERDAIADFLNQASNRFENAISAVSRSIDLAKERRAALITAAVTGQIPVEDLSP